MGAGYNFIGSFYDIWESCVLLCVYVIHDPRAFTSSFVGGVPLLRLLLSIRGHTKISIHLPLRIFRGYTTPWLLYAQYETVERRDAFHFTGEIDARVSAQHVFRSLWS